MIELHISEYCENCSEFEPDVEKIAVNSYGFGPPIKHDTLITCKHKYRCNDLVGYLENRMKEKE